MDVIMELFQENNYEAQLGTTTKIQEKFLTWMRFQAGIRITITLKTNSHVFLKAGQGITLEISHGGAFDFTPDLANWQTEIYEHHDHLNINNTFYQIDCVLTVHPLLF